MTKRITKKQLSAIVAAATILVICAICFYSAYSQDYFGFSFYPKPGNKYEIEVFTDKDDKVEFGESKVDKFEDFNDSLVFSYTVEPVRFEPYVGLCVSNIGSAYLPISANDQSLELTITNTSAKSIIIQLMEDVPNYTSYTNPLSYRYHQYQLELEPSKRIYTIPIVDFEVKDWWYESNPNGHMLAETNFQRIKAISFRNSDEIDFREGSHKNTLVFHNVSFDHSSKSIMFLTMCLIGSCILGLLCFYIVNRFYVANQQEEVKVEPTKEEQLVKQEPNVEDTTEDWERIKQVVEENYTSDQMTLAFIKKKVKIPEAKISQLFKIHTESNFRTYLNKKRLDKSIKLLESTSSSISQIAEVVGFGYAQTFNRVFKKHYKMTPTEYRESIKEK